MSNEASRAQPRPLPVAIAGWFWTILGGLLLAVLLINLPRLITLARLSTARYPLVNPGGLVAVAAASVSVFILGRALLGRKRWAMPVSLALAGLFTLLSIAVAAFALAGGDSVAVIGTLAGLAVGISVAPMSLLLLRSSREWFGYRTPIEHLRGEPGA